MRLTHLKLAGFKSFVDPTTLHIHGQRIGVVGPNGCGKSNVMESIRWVLGEASAREMRGDSMQDVIFNGSGNRKPVSRASVELLFDNSLGGAAGEWSQYAEISVKRVLTRDSGSSYYINNTLVRRRDVADLFLGTGLGGRAYAIIGQNTISRIVEAKPDELRVFLEEAAGISKYKERRRETEQRLRDTRDNLLRVEDIRGELAKQITRLEAQAQIAQHYHHLQQALGLARGQCWLLKKREAAYLWEKSQRQVERQALELEAQIALLRRTENELVQLRLEHQAGSEAVQGAQGQYYEANAQVSTLEQTLRYARENHERLTAQLAQMSSDREKSLSLRREHEHQLTAQQSLHQQAILDASQAQQSLDLARGSLPKNEQAYRDAQASFGQIQTAMLQAEQQIQLERTHVEHAKRTEEELQQREHRLEQEERGLVLPDAAQLADRETEGRELQAGLTALEAELMQSSASEQAHAMQLKDLQQSVQQQVRQIAQMEAEQATLQKLQHALGYEGSLDAWFHRHGIDSTLRLWQCIGVEPAAETALEALLGQRLKAVVANGHEFSERPPAAVVLCQADASMPSSAKHAAGWAGLASRVSVQDDRVAGVLSDWLNGVWLLPADENAEVARARLSAGELLVNANGDIFSRHSVSFHAPQSGLHGVLERQRELTQIETALPTLQQSLQQQEVRSGEADRQLHELRRHVVEQQQLLRQQTAALHTSHMELQRLQQQFQHALARQQSLSEEKSGLQQKMREAQTQQAGREQTIQLLQQGSTTLRQQREEAGSKRQQAEIALKQTRDFLLVAERDAQQQTFYEKLIINKISELSSKIKAIDDGLVELEVRHAGAMEHLAKSSDSRLKSQLEQALELQRQAEQALAGARNAQAGVEQRLQEMERNRLQTEQQLHPLRDKLEQSRLQEQQARLGFEHCAEQVAATAIDEALLDRGLDKSSRSGELDRHAQQLEQQIAELGAVNLAAITELTAGQQRKTYLDSQSLDLEQAIHTLEEAIHRIDRETRSRLQHTYDEVNRNFNELFQTLFGGGQAQLQLLGDEILDTGVQVFAQPPGKKNSTIHLLSGGEKALTAMALVFALFRLNPAPFCLMDEVDAPLDDSNTERFCALVRKMSERTQFVFVSHNKITMEMAQQLIGVTMQESGVSRIVEVDMEAALRMQTEFAA